MKPLLPVTQRSSPSLARRAKCLARRAKGQLQHAGLLYLGFAYQRLLWPAHDMRAKRMLDFVTIVLGFALNCFLLLGVLLCCRIAYLSTYGTMEDALGYYKVEITGVEASDFLSPLGTMAPPPRFDLTARVTNGYWNTTVCLRHWDADVWYGGTPLGKAYFPDTCLEKMANTSVKSSTSRIELIGLPAEIQRNMEGQKTHGDPKLRIEMMLHYTEYKGRQNEPYNFPVLNWLRCNATTDMQSTPSPCRIRRLFGP